MKNFLLVVPQFVTEGQYYTFPLGLGYISSYLKQEGFNVYCLNLNHYPSDIPIEKIIKEKIENYNIDVFCTGTLSWYWDKVDEMLKIAKRIKPDIINIVGGAIIISDPELALKNLDIDFGIMGEGEITTAELAKALCENKNPYNIQGITFLKNGELVVTAPRPVIDNLDTLPFPDYEGFEFKKWNTLILGTQYIESVKNFDNLRYTELVGSRSCPFKCTFCYHHLGDKYRQRSLDNIFLEIEYLIEKYGINYFYFFDELFSANHKRMLDFSARIKKYNIAGWGGSFRVNDVNLDILKNLKESGLKYIGYGLENINDEILISMNKRITKVEIENALKLTREAGIHYTGNFIFGDPAETEETIKKSIKWIFDHPFYNVSLVSLMTIPNSPIYQLAIKRKLITDKLKHVKEKFPLINLTQLSDNKYYKYLSKITWIDQSKKQIRQGTLIKSTLESSKGKIKIFKVEAVCPFCNKTGQFDRCYNYQKKETFLCANCVSTFYLPNFQIFQKHYNKFTTNINYYKQFFLTYLIRFKFYRNNQDKIVPFLINAKRKIKSFLLFFSSKP